MAKFFVTGGAGFIGSHLVKKLSDEGHEAIVFDSLNQYIFPIDQNYLANMQYRFTRLLSKAQMVRGSTLNKDDLRRQIVRVEPEYIIHFAALPLANMAIHQSEEAFNSILKGTANILEILRDVKFVKRMVLISSSMIYGDFRVNPQPEEGEKDPKEIYGSLKLAAEILVRTYSKRYGFDYTIVRPSAVYGPTDNNRRVLQIFLENARKGVRTEIKNGKSTFLDFTFVEDTAEGIKLAALSPAASGEAFNVTFGRGRSLEEAFLLAQQHYPGAEANFVDEETFHPKRGSLDISKARAKLSYAPNVPLEDGIKKYIEYLETFNT